MTQEQDYKEKIVRILSKDIDGNMPIYAGLIKIKGISWGLANAICNSLNLDKNRKIGSLNKSEIQKIENFMEKPDIPEYVLNRKKDLSTGENKHLIGTKLELTKNFDIKRLKQIKSYKGKRHSSRLTLRGQKTKANFRKNKAKKIGIKKK